MESALVSSAAQVIIAIIPIVGIVIGGVAVFFYLLSRHREISLQIKTGCYRPKQFNIKLFSLLTGLLLTGIGLVLTLLFWVVQGFSYPLLGGLLPLVIGGSFLGFLWFWPANSKRDGEA